MSSSTRSARLATWRAQLGSLRKRPSTTQATGATEATRGAGRRVLIIVQNLPVPFDRRVWLEATTLTKAGYQVSVISPKALGYEKSFEVIEDIEVFRYWVNPDAEGPVGFAAEFVWCFLRSAMLSVRVSRRRGFDILHVCNPPETFFPLGWAVKALGKKFLFDHHDLSPEMYKAKYPDNWSKKLLRMLLWLERRTFRAADIVVTTNASHKRVAVERGDLDPGDVYIVRSGPDLTRLELVPAEPEWRRGRSKMVAYLGEICKQDGVDHLVRAMKIIRDDLGRDDIHCVLMGGGPYQPAIKEYAEEIGIDDYCTFTGRVSDEDLCRVLSSADVGVDPDPKNDWSDQSTMNKIMEYMYFGLPVVCYDLTESRVSAQESAIYATANDERALAQRIVEIIDDPAQATRMGEIGRDRIVNELSWENSVEPLLDAYDAIQAK